MLAAWDGELLKSAIERRGLDAEISWLLVRDLLGEDHADALQSRDLDTYQQAVGAGLAGGVPNPDAGIIAACKQVEEAWAEYWRFSAEEEALPIDRQPAYEEAFLGPIDIHGSQAS